METVDQNRRPTAVFHIGLHKTGTSALQKNFFIEENGFKPFPRKEVIKLFVDKSSIEELNDNESKRVKEFAEAATASNLTAVFSHERLSGYPLSGGYDRLSIWNRIAALDIDIKIVLVVREQRSWIYSAWKQMITDGGAVSLNEFLYPKKMANVRFPPIREDYLNYALLASALYKIFGRENVCILPWEMIRKDGSNFYSRLQKFTDANKIDQSEPDPKGSLSQSVNIGQSILSIIILRYGHKFLFKTQTSLCGILDRDRSRIEMHLYRIFAKLTRFSNRLSLFKKDRRNHKVAIEKAVKQKYAKSNEVAAELIGINLANFGYVCPNNSGK